MYPCLHDCLRCFHHCSDFLVRQLTLNPEEERRALCLGQLGKTNLECLIDFVAWIACGCLNPQLGRVYRDKRATLLSLQFVQQQITSDSKKVGGKLGRGLVARGGGVELDEDLLGEILGVGMVDKGTMEEAKERGLPTFDEASEGGFLTKGDPLHEQNGFITQRFFFRLVSRFHGGVYNGFEVPERPGGS
tara:strand:- start:275 stop:844 length:570 start_codon:yes stop_codon:yes gene_type:complete